MSPVEGNLDGLPGPTHNYAGLAAGNEASQANARLASNPRAAALQGLAKMRRVHGLGIPQLVMPPHPRPNVKLLRALGFTGPVKKQVANAAASARALLPYIYSAAGMWAANAATVCPSADAADGNVHFVPANMAATPHRTTEAEFTGHVLKRIFAAECFTHHAALPVNALFADEGAANHMRLQGENGGFHVFVHGRDGADPKQFTARYPARQTLVAGQALGRLHGIAERRLFCLRQSPRAIDAGVFHNDVIATSHGALLLYHEEAFADADAGVKALQAAARPSLTPVKVATAELTLEEAVSSYLFNSQIVGAADVFTMIAPQECAENKNVKQVIDRLLADDGIPIREAIYMDLRESMRNGGGPACLRLRIPLEEEEWKRVAPQALFTPALHEALAQWVEKHYRDRLLPEDLADPALAEEALAALDALEALMGWKGIYDF
ncbi:MAG: N-succinylarginine dihydrolase [Alphaproteobacteria bacterium]|nr:N-succinylarginine dihydrolase [Alphaproteobacteria bacterium]